MTAVPSIDPARFLNEQLSQASPDLLRDLLTTFVNALLSAQADAVCGAGYGERSDERVNSRNGYRHRDLDTRIGTLDVAVPKLRTGSLYPGLVEIERLLTDYLEPRGLDPTTISALFKAVTLRVVCLVQRDLAAHEFQFDVQPLREYFAASYLYDMAAGTGPKNARSACLGELAKRPFWNNVARFYAGRFTTGEIPGIPYALRAMQSAAAIGAHPVSRTVAKQLLDDQVLVGQLELMTTDVLKVIFDGSGPILAADGLIDQGETRPHFQPGAGAKHAAEVLTERLRSATEPDLVAAAAQLLEDLDAGDSAAQVWWERIGEVEPVAWMATAATLGLLDDAEPSRVTAVDSLLSGLDASIDALPFLASSRSGVLSDARVRRGIEELRRGHGGFIDLAAGRGNPYARLVAASTAALLHGSAGRDNAGATASVQNAVADPARWTAGVTSLEAAYAAQVAGQRSWSELLDTIATVWGEDCWPIREVVLALPTDHFPDGHSDSAAIVVGTSWRGVAGWLAEAHEHRADLTWWTTSSRICTDELASMTFVAAAMLHATNETLVGLAAELNHHTGRLSRPRWATTAAAVQRSAGYPRGARQLMLEQPLRLGRLKPGGTDLAPIGAADPRPAVPAPRRSTA